jgi:aromatic ring-opening dioxygenase catalytic subunit (LigB family)
MLSRMAETPSRLPVVFLPHGGGPWPFVKLGFGSEAEQADLAQFLRGAHALPQTPPKALLVISAHWEEPLPTVMNGAQPPLLFDYYGFPAEAYQLSWPAPGAPALAARVQSLLADAGIESGSTSERGFDHGTFVPLKLAYPDAKVPTVQLSLKAGLDPREHLAIGRALLPLRDEGVFIIGSGMTYHNMRAMGPQGRPAAATFDAWLREAATLPAAERDAKLAEWQAAPAARAAHPREEHLLPLMVVAGAAGVDQGRIAYRGSLLGLEFSGYAFG